MTARRTTEDAARWFRLGATVGTASFAPAALAVVAAAVPRDMEWIVVYGRRHAPLVLHHEVTAEAGSGIDRDRIREGYDAGFFRFDPFYRHWREEGRAGVVTMRAAMGGEAGDLSYAREFMPITGMADDVAVLLPLGDGEALALCLERRSVFTAGELALLEDLYPLLSGLAESHGRITGPAGGDTGGAAPLDFEAAVASFLPNVLTPREREIVRLALAGFANEAIGRRLGVATGTVKNHRKRLHAKLDITSERELFSLFLGHLAGLDASALS